MADEQWWESDLRAAGGFSSPKVPPVTSSLPEEEEEEENWWERDLQSSTKATDVGRAYSGLGSYERPVEAPQESIFRSFADPFLNIGAGINDVVKGFTDAFGADNAVSQNLAKNSEWYRSLLSAGAKEDAEEIGRIMQEAEGQGVLAEIGAGLKALSVAPIDLVSQGIGSLIPFIATAGVGKAIGLSRAGVAVLQGVQGGAVGGGIVKGEIYDAVKEQLINSGVDEAKAEKAANEAQAYNGKNLDQILLGVGLGVAASSTGAEGAIRSLITRKAGQEAAKEVTEQEIQKILRTGFVRGAAQGLAVETTTEALQGGQERLAANVAVGREGFDVEPMRGVFGQATLEGALGGILGGGAGGISAKVEQLGMRESVALRDAAKAAQEAKQNNAPASAAVVEEQINQTLEETPEQRVARLQEEATAAAGIELEEEGVGVEPPVTVTPPVEPAPEGAVAPVEPVVEPVVAEPQPIAEVAPTRRLADLDVRPPTDNVRQVAQANDLTVGREDANVPAAELESTVNVQDPNERKRVDDLKEKITSEEGFISRVIVDGQNNVVEGQHRVQAMKELGYDEIPVVRLKGADDFIPDSEALDKVMVDAGLTASDNRNQMRQLIGEIISDEKGDVTKLKDYEAPAGFEAAWDAATEEVIRQNAPAVTPPVEVAPEVTPTPETPNLEPLRRVARAEQTEEDVSGLVGQGLVELYNGQPVITQAGLETLPEAERPRLNPEARKIQIDTGSNEVVAEAISKNLRIGVDQVGPNVTLPTGWTLDGDIYVPPAAPEVRESRREPAPLTQQDREYLDAVERGDLDAGSRAVNEAAKSAGYTIKAYHGTTEPDITVFSGRLGSAVHVALNKNTARSYADNYLTLEAGQKPSIYEVFVNVKNTFDARNPDHFNQIGLRYPKDFPWNYKDLEENINVIKAAGFDSYFDYEDSANTKPDGIAVFNERMVKLSNTITKDDRGNIIPPSQRFQTREEDIRYSLAERGQPKESQVVSIPDPDFPNRVSPKEYHKLNSVVVNQYGDTATDVSKIVASMKKQASSVKDKVYGKKFLIKIDGQETEYNTPSALQKALGPTSDGAIARVYRNGNNQIVADFEDVPSNVEIAFREESRFARREPSVEARQQYAPKTEEEQASFDKASSNKVLARSPQLAVAAVRMKNGEITAGEYADLVDAIDPFTAKGADPIPTKEKIQQYISSDKAGQVMQPIESGKEVEFRIDIPTYNRSTAAGDTVYAVTAHEPVAADAKGVGKVISFVGVAKVKNPTFMTRAISGRGTAADIAAGAGKFPLATVKGNYEPITDLPADINDPNIWTEVGYNPIRSSFFVDVRSKDAVVGGSEAIMVGSRVFVKDAVLEPRPTGVTMGERYAKIQMPRPAGMETEAVATKLESLGFGRGGIVSVVNEPDASFEGRTIIRDGKVVSIELNAAALKDDAAVERVLNHEIAESANADGALNRLVAGLTPKERKEINDAITRLGYAEKARTAEEAARAVELLAEGWRGRKWFDRAVARVEAWANKLGYKLTRRAAEYIAARNVSEINAEFKQAYNKFINVRGEAREGRAFVTPAENARFLELAQNPEANREELQKMVDAAAEKAGFKVFDWWHGTKKDFNIFKATRYEDGLIFFSSKRDFSERWARNRKPNDKILERIESVRSESRKLVNNLFEADPRFDIKRTRTEDTPEMREAAEKYLEAGKEFERSKLDGMTWIEAEREMGVRIIHAYLKADRIFDPSKDWREVLPAILSRLGIKSEAEIEKQSMDMLLKGNYLIWEDKKLTDAVFEKFDAMMIQEDSDGPMDTIAVRDPSLIKMADPITRDDQGNIIPLSERFQTAAPDIRYSLSETRESRREDAIPTFSEGSPEASTLSTMAASMAKVDGASEGKPNPENKPTYKISEIASVWMDQGGDARQLQDLISENTNLTPANAKKVANAIAKQYDIQQSIATAFLETQTGLSVEALPEGVTLPKEVDPDRPRPVMQRLFDVFMGVKVSPVKITVNEKTALNQQIRLKAAANRAAKAEQKRTAEEVVEIIKAMELLGPVRPKQVQALAKRAARVIWTSEKSVEAFSEYAAKVVENANYDADLREAKDAQKRAKQLSTQKKVAMSPQREVLEDVSKIPVNKLDDPRMFAEAVNYYLRGFKAVLSPDYVVIPDAEMESYLSGAQSETQRNQRDLDREANERLAKKYGIEPDQVNEMMESIDIIKQIEAQENREALENLLTEKAIETQQGLRGYDTDNLRADQRSIVSSMLKVDPKALDPEERQRFIRITNNIIYNNQTNGAEYFVAVAKGQQSAREAAQDSTMVAKNRAWINLLPRFISERMQRGWALELQSIADTFRNAFGKGAMAKMYDAMGMLDLNLGFTKANNTIDEIQEKIAEFHRNLEKKYKAAARNQDGLLAEGVVGFLIQSVPKKDELTSINQRRDLIRQDIANRRRSTTEPDRVAMADRIEAILNQIDGDSIEAILNNMKREFPANHESLIWYKDTLLPQYKDFLKNFDENFNDQANNYENPNYLTIGFTSAGPSLAITPEEQSLFYDQVSLRPKQSAYTIKRVDYSEIPKDRTTGKPKEIEFNLRRNVFNGLSDQINKAYTSSGWQRIASFMKTPEAETVFGGAANKDFFIERLNRLRLSRMRRGSMGSGGAIEKAVDSLSVISRKLGTGIALGGIYQWIKQPPDQLITAWGSGGRGDLLAKNIAPKTQKLARTLLNKFSIGRRGDASAGYKYINQMEGHQNRLERYFSESKWDQAKEQAGKIADVWMIALKSSDFLAASAAWMTYYEGELNKQDIKIDDWSKEADLIESDPARRQAAAFAEQMTDIYQGSSDPTSMATFAQSGKTGWENLVKAIFVPFNSFAIQQRMRLYSDARDAISGSKSGVGGLSGTIGGLILFHATKRYVIPAISGAGIGVLYGLMGVDMEEPDEEKQKEEANKNWRQFLADITGNLLVGGTPQIVESKFIDAMNRASYLVSLQLENDSILNDDGEIMSYDQYSKERSPFYRYQSFDNAMSLGMLEIGLGQAEQVALQTKMLATPEEMEMYTPEEQRLLYFSALSEWLYMMRLNDADFARLVGKARRDMIKAAKDREKELQRIRSGR